MFTLNDAANRAFGGQARVEMLRNLLENLHRRGIKLVIVSYNTKALIQKVLSHALIMRCRADTSYPDVGSCGQERGAASLFQ